MTLYILNYNNYYNRTVKKFDTMEGYEPYVIHTIQNINFNPNDGVQTLQTPIGNVNNLYDGRGDYVVVTDSENNIVSRWFIIESVRAKGGQWSLTLYRDLVVDHYDQVLNADCFIEKAILNDEDNFIFNNENMTYNQIKTKEEPLKDKTNCAWIVGYYDNKGASIESGQTFTDIGAYDVTINETYSDWLLQNFGGTNKILVADPKNMEVALSFTYSIRYVGSKYYGFNVGSSISPKSWAENVSSFLPESDLIKSVKEKFSNNGGSLRGGAYLVSSYPAAFDAQSLQQKLLNDIAGSNIIFNQLLNGNYIPSLVSEREYIENILSLQNKIIRFKKDDNSFEYRKITLSNTGEIKKATSITTDNSLTNAIKNVLGYTIEGSYLSTKPEPGIYIHGRGITISSEVVNITTYSLTFEDKGELLDAGYGIFAMPYNRDGTPITIYKNDLDDTGVNINTEFSIRYCTYLATKLGTKLYDLQLLPYCPLDTLYNKSMNRLSLNDDDNSQNNYIEIKNSNEEVVSYLLFPRKCNFSIIIDSPLNFQYNKKIESETSFCRLTSPNFAGQFEFNIAKNNGFTAFNIDCTYKPFTPYIHINPIFGGIYGEDWDDSRGLICGGDFSLEIYSDPWEQYQIQNKNYQNIFDRQIQNMDIKNNVQASKDIASAIFGTAEGIISGSRGGVAGSIIGGAMGAAQGITNYSLNEILRNEAIDYEKDLFGYQLGNIQALPTSLSKTSALTFNNKIFPILEYYTCTDIEKEALANKIAYNGMTVMRIGKISDFIDNNWSFTINNKTIQSRNYIKGQLIKLDDIGDDFHISNAIASEINKGLYFKEVTNG